MPADWMAARWRASVQVLWQTHPATRPRRDRNRRRDGSALPAPAPSRHGIFFRSRSVSLYSLSSFRGLRSRNPESRDSGFDASRRPGMTASPSIIDHDRPDLDRTRLGAGDARGNGKRGVEILGFDQIVAPELLARLRERTIRRQGLAVANPHGGRRRRRLQPVAGLEMAALDNGLGEYAVVRH